MSSHVTEKLPLWAGGDLPEREMQSVQAHLGICPACSAEAQAYGEALSWLQAPVGMPFTEGERIGIRSGVMAKIRSDRVSKKSKKTSRLRRFAPLLLAAAASMPAYILFYGGAAEKPPVAPSRPSHLALLAASSQPSSTAGQDAQEAKKLRQMAQAAQAVKGPAERPVKNRSNAYRAKNQPANTWPDPSITRIEFQTEDSNIKIIWVPPSTSTATDLFGDANEQPI